VNILHTLKIELVASLDYHIMPQPAIVLRMTLDTKPAMQVLINCCHQDHGIVTFIATI